MAKRALPQNSTLDRSTLFITKARKKGWRKKIDTSKKGMTRGGEEMSPTEL